MSHRLSDIFESSQTRSSEVYEGSAIVQTQTCRYESLPQTSQRHSGWDEGRFWDSTRAYFQCYARHA